jgi:hypothetical protein
VLQAVIEALFMNKQLDTLTSPSACQYRLKYVVVIASVQVFLDELPFVKHQL